MNIGYDMMNDKTKKESFKESLGEYVL